MKLAAIIGVTLPLLCLLGAAEDHPATIGDFNARADVGKVEHPGSAEYDASKREYRVTGSGDNIWAARDAFHFLWRKVSGDLTLQADIRFDGKGKVAHRKACLMIRQSLEPDAPYADVAVHGDGLISLQYRKEGGGQTAETQSKLKNPATVRLERNGDRFTLSVAGQDGECTPVGSITLSLHDPVFAGLAVCSHDPAVSETAIFSHLTIHAKADKAPQ